MSTAVKPSVTCLEVGMGGGKASDLAIATRKMDWLSTDFYWWKKMAHVLSKYQANSISDEETGFIYHSCRNILNSYSKYDQSP